MRKLLLLASVVTVSCSLVLAQSAHTPAMALETAGAWRSVAPELLTEFKEGEIWSVRHLPLADLNAGVQFVSDPVKEGKLAGRWADHPRFPTISTAAIPHDWSGCKTLSFWAHSEVATGELITLAAQSDNPQTPWLDYYLYTFAVNWTGWRQVQISLSDCTPYEQPAGWQQVDALYFFTKIFDRQPNPYTVLVLDDLRLSPEAVPSNPPPWLAPPPPAGKLSIHGAAPAFDPTTINHPYPELRTEAKAPVQVLPYYMAERALFGYYPRFHPGFVSFDPQGKPVLQYGAGIIETLGADGKWQVRDLLSEVVEPYVREQMGYKSLELSDGGSGNETAIRWDKDGGVYLLVNVSERNTDWKTRKALLLYSPDAMKTWQVYLLPDYMVRFEKLVGHNPDCLNRPPLILLSHYLSPTKIYLLAPEKQPDGTLKLPEPVLLCEDAVALAPHSGESNQALTHGEEVFLVYGRLVVLPGKTKEDGVPSFARTYNLKTKQLSAPVLIGCGGRNAEDGHNWPGVVADSQGLLHVVINGHHDPFVYTHSVRPWDITEWTAPEKVAAGTSYAGLICDDHDNLYTVTRHSDPGYYFKLSLHRKPAGQPWAAPQQLVIPYKPYYHVYYHKLTLDPVRQRLWLCYWAQTASLCLFRDEFYAARNMWPDREKSFLTGTPNLPQGSYMMKPAKYEFYTAPPSELCVMVSDDRGATWHLATTEDFR